MNGYLNLQEELSKTNKNIDDGFNSTGQYSGKNVRSSINEEVYHISDKGAMKYFQSPYILSSTMGKNGCPADYINIDQDLKSESFLKENPTFFSGTPMVNTGENEGQSCGAGINVIADQLPNLETSTVGCFTSNDGMVIGNDKTFEQCKTMAADKGFPMFSLNTTVSDNGTLYQENNGTVSGDTYCQGGWGSANGGDKNMDCLYGIDSHGNNISCSTSGVLMENNAFYCVPKNNVLKPDNVGICYGFNNTQNSNYYTESQYSLKTVEIPLNSCTYVNEEWRYNISGIKSLRMRINGIYELINQGEISLIAWASPNANDACAYGGGVDLSTLTATYGGNCSSQCSVNPGNYNENVIKLINGNDPSTYEYTPNYENLKNPSFYVGTQWTEYLGPNDPNNKIGPAYGTSADPCYGCSKDFIINYQCGKNSNQETINISPSADGANVNLNCQSSYMSCITGIGISDDGDVKILRDIYGDPKELFAISEPYKGKLIPVPVSLSFPAWVEMKNKITITFNGKKYNVVYGPGEIKKDQFILSPSATCFFQITDSLPIIGYYTEKLSCNSINGNYTGIQSASVGSVDSDTEWCINTRSKYGIIPYVTWGTLNTFDIQSKWNETNCNELSNNPKPESSIPLFAINQFTNPLFIGNYGKQGYVDDEMVLHEYSAELMPTFNEWPYSTIISGNVLSITDYTTDEQCKVECIKKNCDYISTNSFTCSTYSDKPEFGGSSTKEDKVFERIKPAETTSQNCPFQDMKSISTSTWEHYVKGETMTPQTSCYTDHSNFLNGEIARSNDLYSNINDELVKQNEETNNYLTTHKKNMYDIISDVQNINTMQQTIDNLEGFSLPTKLEATSENLYNQSLELKTYNTNQMLLWTFITIIFVSMNYLLIFSEENLQKTNVIWLVVIIILLIIGGIVPLFSIS